MKTFEIVVVAAAAVLGRAGAQLVTCPGFAGYCSESYPGDTCTVVCAFGRNNVPLCQADGTWTDEPRCIEHEPGQPTQRTGWCPGIPGYCSLSPPGSLCEFDCLIGADISSSCKPDGTWDPYPTCEGDIRETRDGCSSCPGPFGGPRDRSKEGGNKSGGKSGGSRQSPARKQSGNSRNSPRAIGGNNRAKQNNVPSARNNNKGAGNRRNNNNRRNQNKPKQNNRRNNNKNAGNRRNGNKRNNNRNSGGNKRNNGGNRKSNRNNNNRRPGASQGRSNNRSSISAAAAPQPKSNNRKGGGCTEEVLSKCMDVCPSEPLNIFQACIKGCAKRC